MLRFARNDTHLSLRGRTLPEAISTPGSLHSTRNSVSTTQGRTLPEAISTPGFPAPHSGRVSTPHAGDCFAPLAMTRVCHCEEPAGATKQSPPRFPDPTRDRVSTPHRGDCFATLAMTRVCHSEERSDPVMAILNNLILGLLRRRQHLRRAPHLDARKVGGPRLPGGLPRRHAGVDLVVRLSTRT